MQNKYYKLTALSLNKAGEKQFREHGGSHWGCFLEQNDVQRKDTLIKQWEADFNLFNMDVVGFFENKDDFDKILESSLDDHTWITEHIYDRFILSPMALGLKARSYETDFIFYETDFNDKIEKCDKCFPGFEYIAW